MFFKYDYLGREIPPSVRSEIGSDPLSQSGILIYEKHLYRGAWLSAKEVDLEGLAEARQRIFEKYGMVIHYPLEVVNIWGISGYGEYAITTLLKSADEFLDYYDTASENFLEIDMLGDFKENGRKMREFDERRLKLEGYLERRKHC